MASPYRADLVQLLAAAKPSSILNLGPEAEIFSSYVTDSGCRLVTIPAADVTTRLANIGRFDFAFVARVIEHLPKAQGAGVIAALRDVHAARLVAAIPLGSAWAGHASHWEPGDLFALGLRALREYPTGEKTVQLFEFDIAQYKNTPDWLNSKHWANPDLFDKFRW